MRPPTDVRLDGEGLSGGMKSIVPGERRGVVELVSVRRVSDPPSVCPQESRSEGHPLTSVPSAFRAFVYRNLWAVYSHR